MPVINDNNNTYLNSITIPNIITYGDIFDIVVSSSDLLTNILITTNDTSIFSINPSNNQITVIGVIPSIQTDFTITCTQGSESITTNLLIITKKDEQFSLERQKSEGLLKELKAQRTKTFLYKIGSFVGIIATSIVLLK